MSLQMFGLLRKAISLTCVFASLVLLVPVANAQFLDQGGLTGVVQDSSGAGIPNAKVTLKNPDTGLVLNTRADKSGVYVFSPIKIGNYSVTAAAQGFSQTTQDGVRISLGQRSSVDLKLNPGAVDQTVTVTAAPPLLQTQDSSTGAGLHLAADQRHST